jgi:hypothetical protein
MELPTPASWRQVLQKSLLRTSLIAFASFLLALALGQNLFGPLTVFVKQVQQDLILDQLSQRLYRFPSRAANRSLPRVVLLDLDLASMQRHSPKGYITNRALTDAIVRYAARYQPSAMFIDLDLEQGSQENGAWSDSDQRLRQTLRQISYPVLLPNAKVLGEPPSALNPKLLEVNPNMLSAGDGVARWVPGVLPNAPVPASLALYCAATGKLTSCLESARLQYTNRAGERLVFHQIERNTQQTQRWKNFDLIPVNDFLEGAYPVLPETQGTVFLLGRSDAASGDFFLTPVDKGNGGGIPGIDLHANALMNLITYDRFLSQNNPVVLFLVLPVVFFIALFITYALTDRIFLGFVVRNKASKNPIKRYWLAVLDGLEGWLIAFILFVTALLMAYYFGYFLDFALPVVAFSYLLRFPIWQKKTA